MVSLQVFPAPGETVRGDHLEEVAGGKGLNQAVAAAHEAACAFVGCAGDGGAGRLLTEALVRLGRSVVVTNGPDGAHAGTSTTGIAHAPGQRVTPVDTTGAVEVFAGTLAAHLSQGASLVEAARAANAAATRIVQVPRAQR